MKTLSLTVFMVFLATGRPFIAYAGQIGSQDVTNVTVSEEEPIQPIVPKSSEILIKESSGFGIAAMIFSALVPLAFFVSFLGVINFFVLGLLAWPISIVLAGIGIFKVVKARRRLGSPWEEYDDEKWKKSKRALLFNTIALVLAAAYPIALMFYISTVES